MASPRLRPSPRLLCLLAVVTACGPTGPADTSTTATSQTSGDDTTAAAPTSGSTGPTTTAVPTTGTADLTTGDGTSTGAVGTSSSDTGASSTGTTETATGASSTTTGDEPFVCQAPAGCEPIFFEDADNKLTDVESGWVICEQGTLVLREEPVACAHEVFWPKCEGQGGQCASDADCPGTEACANVYGDCSCVAQCMSDSDCGDGEICLCTGGHPELPVSLYIKNTCVASQCAATADCEGPCGCRGNNFCGYTVDARCSTPTDECAAHSDCEGGDLCVFDEIEARWRCLEGAICE